MTIFRRRNCIRSPRVARAALCIAWSVVAAGGPNVALAADPKPGKAVAAEPTPWEFAFGGALMSDYNYRGISVSARRPSVTVYAEPRYKVHSNLELYAGLSAASVDLPNRPAAQIVYAAGIRPKFGALQLDLGAEYLDYPGGILFDGLGTAATCTNGAFFLGQCNTSKAVVSFWQAYAYTTFAINDRLTVGGILDHSPSWSNSGAPATYAALTVKADLPRSTLPAKIGAFVSGEIGRYWLGTTDAFYGLPAFPAGVKLPDYTTWHIGLGLTYKTATLDLRYYDTDLSKANCNVITGDHTATFGGAAAITPINPGGLISRWCSAAVILKLSFDLTLAGSK
jgi:Bacterial protein of unknown function (Gcw_chp)